MSRRFQWPAGLPVAALVLLMALLVLRHAPAPRAPEVARAAVARKSTIITDLVWHWYQLWGPTPFKVEYETDLVKTGRDSAPEASLMVVNAGDTHEAGFEARLACDHQVAFFPIRGCGDASRIRVDKDTLVCNGARYHLELQGRFVRVMENGQPLRLLSGPCDQVPTLRPPFFGTA